MTEQELEQELENQLGAARRASSGWNAGRQQQVKWAIMASIDRPRRRWRLLFPVLALGCAAGAAIGVLGWRHLLPNRTGAGEAASGVSYRPLPKLADGSSIVLDGPSAILKKTVETNDEVVFELEAGGAHFEVARRPSRIFRVHAGHVTVQVIGTRFHVQRQDSRAQVSVDRGKVLVSWWGGSRELSAGEQGTFPPERAPMPAPGVATAPPSPSRPIVTGTAHPVTPAPPVTAPSAALKRSPPARGAHFESVNKRGGFASAPAASIAVTTADGPAMAPGAQGLFALADRARGQGRTDAALGHLREILDRYPQDPHAPMAAFTVGRLLLESQKQPRQAAAAFAQARALANGGPLAEDALAREVEALHEAGDTATARDRAELYARLFPRGPRLHTVMRFGGLRSSP